MSRIGKLPITLPAGVDVRVEESTVVVSGKLGTLTQGYNPDISIVQDSDVVRVARPSDNRDHRALHGLTRALLANMVIGVSEGYRRTLELVGAGYRAQQSDEKIILQV